MKINSGKKALLCGVIYGILTFIIYVAFTCFLYYFFDGENFVYKGETRETLNGISFISVEIIGGIISSLIPIFLMRYNSSDYYISSVFIGALLYAFLFVMVFFVGLSSMPLSLVQECPLNSFDALIYGVFVFPFGAIVGMLITPIINYIINRKHTKTK